MPERSQAEMTDDARQRAEQLYDEILVTGPRKVCVEQLLAFARAQRRAVWEEVQQQADLQRGLAWTHIGPLWNAGWHDAMKWIAAWCRRRAQEEKGE